MPKLSDELARPMPAEAKVVHLALCHLGPGSYSAADLAEVLGEPRKGRALSKIVYGAKWLRSRGLIPTATTSTIVAGDEYAKPEPPAPAPAPAPVKKAAKKRAKKAPARKVF